MEIFLKIHDRTFQVKKVKQLSISISELSTPRFGFKLHNFRLFGRKRNMVFIFRNYLYY